MNIIFIVTKKLKKKIVNNDRTVSKRKMTNCESQIFKVIYTKVSDDTKKTSGNKGR